MALGKTSGHKTKIGPKGRAAIQARDLAATLGSVGLEPLTQPLSIPIAPVTKSDSEHPTALPAGESALAKRMRLEAERKEQVQQNKLKAKQEREAARENREPKAAKVDLGEKFTQAQAKVDELRAEFKAEREKVRAATAPLQLDNAAALRKELRQAKKGKQEAVKELDAKIAEARKTLIALRAEKKTILASNDAAKKLAEIRKKFRAARATRREANSGVDKTKLNELREQLEDAKAARDEAKEEALARIGADSAKTTPQSTTVTATILEVQDNDPGGSEAATIPLNDVVVGGAPSA